MKVTEIKGIVPGAGKTTTLAELFVKSNLKNKIILTPSNKARQVCISKLMSFGYSYEKASKSVSTMRKFKHNFYEHTRSYRYFDIEACEWIERDEPVTYITKKSNKHYKKIWNIYIDEASMLSKEEIDDLVNNWKIQNLVLDGDSLQFDPIGNIERLDNDSKVVSEWYDLGLPYDLNIDNQVLLNKSMRARDEKLQQVIDDIKAGEILEAIIKLVQGRRLKECENEQTDYHITYTNRKCDKLNEMYIQPQRYIVTHTDFIHGFFTSEVLEEGDLRLIDLERRLMYEGFDNKKVPTFDEWKKAYLKPAYALTCHKLQGSTIAEGDIFIHLDDILYGLQEVVNVKERARIFQKFLYVAVSRAVNLNQINVYGFSNYTLLDCIRNQEGFGPMKRALDENGEVQWVRDEDYDEVITEIQNLQDYIGPMFDDTIREDADQFAADDPELVKFLLGCLEYDENNATVLQGEDDYVQLVKAAHSIKHKQHKQHKQHKPHKTKYTDEYLLSFNSLTDLRKVTLNDKIIRRFRELKNLL